MSEPALNALIVSNIRDLDAAAYHLTNSLQPEIARALDEVADPLRTEAGWDGEADWNNDGIWLAPMDWRSPDGDGPEDHMCTFWLTHDFDELEQQDTFWLTELVGEGRAKLGFCWSRENVNKPRWRKELAKNSALIEEARKLGFSYFEKSGQFFLPVTISAAELARAVAEEAPEQALKPFEDALRKLIAVKPFFDRLLAAVVVD